jgi:hypothetical protein
MFRSATLKRIAMTAAADSEATSTRREGDASFER